MEKTLLTNKFFDWCKDVCCFFSYHLILRYLYFNFYFTYYIYFMLNKRLSFLRFTQCLDLIALHYVERFRSYELTYCLLNLFTQSRSCVKVSIFSISNESEKSTLSLFMQSIHLLYASLVWYEREVWDLYGIWFLGNVFLKRILTNYGQFLHIGRKDVPLCGVEKNYFYSIGDFDLCGFYDVFFKILCEKV